MIDSAESRTNPKQVRHPLRPVHMNIRSKYVRSPATRSTERASITLLVPLLACLGACSNPSPPVRGMAPFASHPDHPAQTANTPPHSSPRPTPTRSPILANPSDLDAAVRFAAGRHGLAVTSIILDPVSETRTYELMSVYNETGTLTLTPATGRPTSLIVTDDPAASNYVADLSVGRFGRPDTERAFFEEFRSRLRTLNQPRPNNSR